MSTAQAVRQVLKHFITPDQYDYWSQELGSTAAWNRCFARVVERREEARDTVTLILKPNGHFPGYQAGQHINIAASIKGRRITRCYSLTSIADDGDRLSITVRRDKHGLMSNWLCTQAQPGTRVEITRVFGDMTLDNIRPAPEDQILMLAAGSGITPLYSLVRAGLKAGHSGAIRLLYWDHDPASFCFREELKTLAGRYPQFQVEFLSTQGTDTETPAAGRIRAEQLDTLLGKANGKTTGTQPIAFVCGGSAFVEKAKQLLEGRARQCHSEAFTPPAPLTEEVAEQMVSVELLASGKTLSVSNQQTLLASLEAAGIQVDSGCRMGICNTCVCQSLKGNTRDITTGHTNPSGPTRLCISQPMDAMQIDL